MTAFLCALFPSPPGGHWVREEEGGARGGELGVDLLTSPLAGLNHGGPDTRSPSYV